MPTTHLLYLHGFRSSPQSHKAQQMQAHVRATYPGVHWWCPQLPPSPRAAADLIASGTAGWPSGCMAVVGSSLGGFYATWWAERTGARAVLLNPAVDPARALAAAIGEQTAWHDPTQHFFFKPEYLAELRALEAGPLAHPERYCALIAQGDEVLDWREAAARLQGADLHILPGGDHALSDFAAHLGVVCDFLQLAR